MWLDGKKAPGPCLPVAQYDFFGEGRLSFVFLTVQIYACETTMFYDNL